MVKTSDTETPKFLEPGSNLYFVLSTIYIVSKEQIGPLQKHLKQH